MRTSNKTSNQKEDLTVADYVTTNFKTAQVFSKYNIDYCCGGKHALKTTCDEKGLSYEEVLSAIEDLSKQNGDAGLNFNTWELSFLADYIVNVHHKYVSEAIPRITQYLEKVTNKHGKQHPETLEIAALFEDISKDLLKHMVKEEQILFPYIRNLENSKRIKTQLSIPPFLTAKNPVAMMEHEHEVVGDLIHQIAQLTSEYTPPKDACNTFKILYAELNEFQNDLYKHVHLENNILFPKSIELESELFDNQTQSAF